MCLAFIYPASIYSLFSKIILKIKSDLTCCRFPVVTFDLSNHNLNKIEDTACLHAVLHALPDVLSIHVVFYLRAFVNFIVILLNIDST